MFEQETMVISMCVLLFLLGGVTGLLIGQLIFRYPEDSLASAISESETLEEAEEYNRRLQAVGRGVSPEMYEAQKEQRDMVIDRDTDWRRIPYGTMPMKDLADLAPTYARPVPSTLGELLE
jgi:hypothetical protein